MVFWYPLKGKLRMQCLFWTLYFSFFASSIPAAPPSNDLIENAAPLGFVGAISNLTNIEATSTPTDPEYSPGLVNIWFKCPTSISSTGLVSIVGTGGAAASLRVYEQRTNGLVRTSFTAPISVVVTNSPGKTNYIGVYFGTMPRTNTFTLTYSFPTLQMSSPSPTGSFVAPSTVQVAITNREPGVEFQKVTVYARATDLGTNTIAIGSAIPFEFSWTNQVAGVIDLFADAVTANGELRRSTTNRLTFKAANDNFENAIELNPAGGSFPFRPFNLTRQSAEPADSTLASMWYRWVPDRSGLAQFTASAGAPLALYTGADVTNLTVVTTLPAVEGVSTLQANVIAGQTYYLAAYQNLPTAQTLSYSVAPLRFLSPIQRTDLKAPNVVDFAVGGAPADTQMVEYYRGTNLIGVAEPPFALRWTNVFTGPIVISAIGRGSSGAVYSSEIIGLNATSANDDFANAIVLPPNLQWLQMQSSAYLATWGTNESGPGIWWRWTPSAAGYCIIAPLDPAVGILVRKGEQTVAEDYDRPVSFIAEAGVTYDILMTHSLNAQNGFQWSIQNSPMKMAAGVGVQGISTQLRPTLLREPAGVARVDYLIGSNVVASAVGPDFVAQWTPSLAGSYDVRLVIVYADGSQLDGGAANFQIGPANDNFDTAQELRGDLSRQDISINQTMATSEPGEPFNNATRTVWWKWTPTVSGRTVINLETSGSDVTCLVGTGNSISNLTIVAADDFTGKGLQFNAEAGKTYFIEIGGTFDPQPMVWHLTQETLGIRLLSGRKPPVRLGIFNTNPNDQFERVDFFTNNAPVGSASTPLFEFVWNQLGTHVFEVVGTNQFGDVRRSLPFELAVVPPNDDFVDAAEIPAQSTHFDYSGTFQNATVEPAELYQSEGSTLWWRWTPAYSGLATIRGHAQNNNGFDAIVATGDSFTNLQYLARIDRFQGSTNMEFRAQAGVTYLISFQNYAGGTIDWTLDQETFELIVPMHGAPIELTLINSNTNDVFTDATILINDTPLVTLTDPNWNYTWNGGPAGKYLISAVATNSAGEKRTTRTTEYWIGPSNNYFADAIETSLTVSNTGNLGGSSFEPGEPRWYPEAIGSVWYKFVPAGDGVYTVTFQSGGQDIFGRSSFYEGSSLGNLQRIAPTYGTNSLASTLVGGQTYFLAVTTTDRSDEPFAFTIDGPPANDLLANAVVLTGSAPAFSGNTVSSSRESEEQAFLGWSITYGSVWYQWTAPETGNASFVVDSAPGELAIMVLSGTSWTNAITHYGYRTLIGWPNGLPMRVVKGTTYSFALYGDPGPFSGHITLQPIDAPSNDFKRDATLLSGNDVRVTGNLFNSTLEIGERNATFGGVFFGGSIWYRWIAPSAGELRFWLDNQASYYTAGLHVLAVPNSNDLNDRVVTTAGQEFYFQVSCPDFQPQLATLNLKFTPQNLQSNDSFANAIPIDPLPYNYQGNMLWASMETNEPMGKYPGASSQTLWWSFIPTEAGVLSLGASSATPPWYPWIVVFRGNEMNSLEYLTESPLNSIVAVPGEEYRIQVQAVANTGIPGDFSLNAVFDPKPTNDMFADRIALQGNSASVHSWIMSPTVESGEPLVAPDLGGTLWWSWTAPSDGRLELSPGFDSLARVPGNLAVYKGDAVNQLTQVLTNGPFTIKAKQGVTYQIQVYPHSTNSLEETGFGLAFYPFSVATNDNFADAAPFDGSPKSNSGATREPGEPQHASGGPNKSLWWKFTAGANASSASIRIAQKTVTNVTIAIYQGGSVDTLRLISKGSDRVLFDTWAGETYYVAAETAEADTGDITLNLYEGLPNGVARPIPGNLVLNPSFEDTVNPIWVFVEVGGSINGVAPDGRNFITMYDGDFYRTLYQDIATTPGTKYRLRFVYAPTAFNKPAFVVNFGGVEIGKVSAADGGWKTADFIVTANSATSRLQINGTGLGASLDQVSLVPLIDPPVIVTQPASATIFAGSTALFHAGITGADPMAPQWFFNDRPIANATDVSLKIDAAHASDAGSYYIVATNAYGRVESEHVTLTVEGSSHVRIVLQPQGDSIFAGQFFALQTAAVGDPPLAYQWFKNGAELPAATNSSLIFATFTPDQAGSYTVRVSNVAETVTSLPAVVTLAASAPNGGGLVWFANKTGFYPGEQITPVFDVDGFTKLTGTNYVAQLYAGTTADSLRPVGAPIPFDRFGTGTWPGRTITLPNIAPGADAFVQARVWQVSAGASYESARALGGKFGRSEVMRIVPMDKLFPPPIPEGTQLPLQSFTLQAGLPNFVTGNLALLSTSADGAMTWQLTGAAGFRYLIERQINSGPWEPFTVLTNATGIATFTDKPAATAQIQFYRARMID